MEAGTEAETSLLTGILGLPSACPEVNETTHSGLSPLTSNIKICKQIYWPVLSLAHLHESDYIFRVSLKVPLNPTPEVYMMGLFHTTYLKEFTHTVDSLPKTSLQGLAL